MRIVNSFLSTNIIANKIVTNMMDKKAVSLKTHPEPNEMKSMLKAVKSLVTVLF